jgi:hypothetical protein
LSGEFPQQPQPLCNGKCAADLTAFLRVYGDYSTEDLPGPWRVSRQTNCNSSRPGLPCALGHGRGECRLPWRKPRDPARACCRLCPDVSRQICLSARNRYGEPPDVLCRFFITLGAKGAPNRDARFVFLSCLSDAQQNSHHCSLRRRVRNQLDASVVLLEPRKLDAIASSHDRSFRASELAGFRRQRARRVVLRASSKSRSWRSRLVLL